MQDDLSISQTDYEDVIKLNDHVEHDGLMPNVYPPRRMFKTRPVEPNTQQQGTDMRMIKALGKLIKDRPLQNQKLMKPNGKGGWEFDYEAAKKYL